MLYMDDKFFINFIKNFFGHAGSLLLHGFFSSCGKWGYSIVAVPRLLFAVASFVAEHGLQGAWASVVVACGLSSCGMWPQ